MQKAVTNKPQKQKHFFRPLAAAGLAFFLMRGEATPYLGAAPPVPEGTDQTATYPDREKLYPGIDDPYRAAPGGAVPAARLSHMFRDMAENPVALPLLEQVRDENLRVCIRDDLPYRENGRTSLGVYHDTAGVLALNGHISPERQQNAAVHEITHRILDAKGLDEAEGDLSVTGQIVAKRYREAGPRAMQVWAAHAAEGYDGSDVFKRPNIRLWHRFQRAVGRGNGMGADGADALAAARSVFRHYLQTPELSRRYAEKELQDNVRLLNAGARIPAARPDRPDRAFIDLAGDIAPGIQLSAGQDFALTDDRVFGKDAAGQRLKWVAEELEAQLQGRPPQVDFRLAEAIFLRSETLEMSEAVEQARTEDAAALADLPDQPVRRYHKDRYTPPKEVKAWAPRCAPVTL